MIVSGTVVDAIDVQMILPMTYTAKKRSHKPCKTTVAGRRAVADYDIVQVAVRLISASTCQKYCRSSKF